MKAEIAALSMAMLVGCADQPAPAGTLKVDPSNRAVTVVDGQPAATAFRAVLVDDAGGERDVTDQTTFSLVDDAFGSWAGKTLMVDGDALGPTRVVAAYGDARAEAEITVYARWALPEQAAPAGAAALFEAATPDSSCAPAIAYPAAGTVLPNNHGKLDLAWSDSHNDLFRVSFATTYLEVTLYAQAESTYLPSALWTRLANEHEAIAMQVSGLARSEPGRACIGALQQLHVTDQPLVGALYYGSETGFYRHEQAMLDEPAERILDAVSCTGCAFSRDGRRIAIPQDPAASIFDVDTGEMLAQASRWKAGTFSARGDKLVVAAGGALSLIDVDGEPLAKLDAPTQLESTDPQLSPDGAWLANVESSGYSATAGSSIVVRRFFDRRNAFGAPTTLVAHTPGVSDYNLSWSPDGQWLAFTRTSGWGTLSPSAALWVVKTDGSGQAMQISAPTANLDIAARWAPERYTDTSGLELFYVTFTAQRQLVTMPFYPEIAAKGLPATGPAFVLSFQSRDTNNQLATWTR